MVSVKKLLVLETMQETTKILKLFKNLCEAEEINVLRQSKS